MEMEKYREIFEQNTKKCVDNFEKIYGSYDEKISFLKKAVENPTFIETIKDSDLIKESINLLVENAKVTETRKMQQANLMPIIQLMFSNVSIEEFKKIMKEDSRKFTLFCVMYIAFQYDTTMKEHGHDHHANIISSLDKYVKGITN